MADVDSPLYASVTIETAFYSFRLWKATLKTILSESGTEVWQMPSHCGPYGIPPWQKQKNVLFVFK